MVRTTLEIYLIYNGFVIMNFIGVLVSEINHESDIISMDLPCLLNSSPWKPSHIESNVVTQQELMFHSYMINKRSNPKV